MKKVIFALVGVTVLIIIFGIVVTNRKKTQAPIPSLPATEQTPSSTTVETEVKSLHFENSVPSHGSILAAVPINVVINFNFDLISSSSITIKKDGKEYSSGEVKIDSNKLGMRKSMDPLSPDGQYRVNYQACWPDGSCHNGQFQFTIDSGSANTYLDLRGKKEVPISLAQIAFNPTTIRISKGTKVIWRNDEETGHYINTDPHAGHNYFPAQNSKLLKKGNTYELTFITVGFYPYHCSAHASYMIGSILVE